MTCCIIGPGLVGSYLGIAAHAATVVVGPSGQILASRARFPQGEGTWNPSPIRLHDVPQTTPSVVATRWNHTPWATLAEHALVAQNGLEQPRAVAVCFLALDQEPNGTIAHRGPQPRIVVPDGSFAWQSVYQAWRDVGIQVDVVGDTQPAQWEKAILNATVGPLCVAHRITMRAVWQHCEFRPLVESATREGLLIAQAAGVTLDQGAFDRAVDFFNCAGDHIPSVRKDPGELPAILGPLLRTATKHHLEIPALRRIAHDAAPHMACMNPTIATHLAVATKS